MWCEKRGMFWQSPCLRQASPPHPQTAASTPWKYTCPWRLTRNAPTRRTRSANTGWSRGRFCQGAENRDDKFTAPLGIHASRILQWRLFVEGRGHDKLSCQQIQSKPYNTIFILDIITWCLQPADCSHYNYNHEVVIEFRKHYVLLFCISLFTWCGTCFIILHAGFARYLWKNKNNMSCWHDMCVYTYNRHLGLINAPLIVFFFQTTSFTIDILSKRPEIYNIMAKTLLIIFPPSWGDPFARINYGTFI